MSDDLGKIIRAIRKSKHLKIDEIIDKENISKAQLLRFEKGDTIISTEKFLNLLQKMNIPLDEFQNIYDNYVLSEKYGFRREIVAACDSKDSNKLFEWLNIWNEKANKEPKNKFYKINAIVIEVLIRNFRKGFIVPDEHIELITNYLFMVDDWGKYELWVFGNCVSIFKDYELDQLASMIISRTDFYKNIYMNKKIVVQTLINVIDSFLECNELIRALRYIEHLKSMTIPVDLCYEKIMFDYQVGKYRFKRRDRMGEKIMRECVETLQKYGFRDKANVLNQEIDELIN